MTDLIPGIYKISSIKHPERIYIGSSYNISRRLNDHFSELRKNKHTNQKLQRHYNKYGYDDLVFSVIHVCPVEELIETEQYFLDLYKPFFNICKIADSTRGIKQSPEVIEKIRLKRIGKKLGPASEERKEKIRQWNIGRKMSDEAKMKMSEARKGKEPWNKGTKGLYSKEHIQKLKDKRKTFRHTEESRLKISKANMGHPAYNLGKSPSIETRKKISESLKGIKRKPLTEEQKEVLRQKALIQWANRSDMNIWHKGKKRIKINGKYKFVDAN